MQLYEATLRSRQELDEERKAQGYTDAWGWWVTIRPGETLTLRDATASDIARCSLREDSSKHPGDWFCEPSDRGALVSRRAIAHLVELPAVAGESA